MIDLQSIDLNKEMPVEKIKKDRLSISEKIKKKWLKVNVKNYFFEWLKEISSWSAEATKINFARNKIIIDLDKKSHNLLNKVKEINKEAQSIKTFSKTPFSDLTEDQRNQILRFNSPEYQLTKQEELKLKNISTEQSEWTKKRKEIIEWWQDWNFLYNIGKYTGWEIAKYKDDNLENDTITSKIIWSFSEASYKVWNLDTDLVWNAKEKFDKYMVEVQQANDQYDRDIRLLEETWNLTMIAWIWANVERFKKSFVWGEYIKAVWKSAEHSLDKMAKWFASDVRLSWNDRSSNITAGIVEFLMAPVMWVFDEKVSGQYWEAGGAVMTAAFEPIMATVSEVSQQMGSNRENADNWAFVVTAAMPFVVWKKRWKYLTEQTTFFNTIKDSQIQKLYIEYIDLWNKVRKVETEFKNKEYIWADKIKNPRETALFNDKQIQRIISDTNIPKKDKIRILENFLKENKIKYLELKKQKKEIWKTKAWNLFDIVATKVWTRNNFIKETLIKNTEIRLHNKVENIKIDNFIESIVDKTSNTIMSEVAKLPKQVNWKWLNSKDKNQAILQREIDIVTRQVDKLWLDIKPQTRTKFIDNVLDVIHQKQWKIKSTTRELKKYQDRKKDFDLTAEELWWTKKEKAQYSKDWEIRDSAEFSAKYEWIKFLEKEGIIEYIANDFNWNRTYKIVEWMESVFNWMKGEIYHYPEHLYKTKEMSKKLEKMEQLAKEGCL